MLLRMVLPGVVLANSFVARSYLKPGSLVRRKEGLKYQRAARRSLASKQVRVGRASVPGGRSGGKGQMSGEPGGLAHKLADGMTRRERGAVGVLGKLRWERCSRQMVR
jgi:hypothetical protein